MFIGLAVMQAVRPLSMIAPLQIHQKNLIFFFNSLVSRLTLLCNYVLTFLPKCCLRSFMHYCSFYPAVVKCAFDKLHCTSSQVVKTCIFARLRRKCWPWYLMHTIWKGEFQWNGHYFYCNSLFTKQKNYRLEKTSTAPTAKISHVKL